MFLIYLMYDNATRIVVIFAVFQSAPLLTDCNCVSIYHATVAADYRKDSNAG
jgi:hypothetical protein